LIELLLAKLSTLRERSYIIWRL